MESTSYDSVNRIWSGKTGCSPLFHENASIGRVILYVLSLNPDLICQINADDDTRRTNGEIHRATLKIAVHLRKRGCTKGDVVGFVCKNSHDLTPAFLATLFLGAPANILDVCFSKDMIIHMFRTTRPKFVFCDYEVASTVEEALKEFKSDAKIIILGEKISNLDHITDFLSDENITAEITEITMHPPEVDKKTCATIFCSSGSTGPSKGVAISHENVKLLCTRLYSYRKVNTNSDRSVFSSYSIFWASGYFTLFAGFFFCIQRIFTGNAFNPEIFLSIIQKYRVNFLSSSSIQVARLADCPFLKDSLVSVERLHVLGNNISNNLANRIKVSMPNAVVNVGYGLTEAIRIASQDKPAAKNGAGYLEPNVKIKILDDNGKQLGIGESGEVYTKTETLFLEYYNNPEATRKSVDEEGWLYTGDVGYFDEDGILYITGRKKEILRYDYFHINPTEIEEILQTHPGILSASVIGIPDAVGNDVITAVVVRKTGAAVTEEELIEFTDAKVEDFMKLRGGVFIVDELPLTVSGKISKIKVKELVIGLHKAKNAQMYK